MQQIAMLAILFLVLTSSTSRVPMALPVNGANRRVEVIIEEARQIERDCRAKGLKGDALKACIYG